MIEKPEIFKKVYAIDGEITQPNMGMKPDDLKRVIETTQIVFHIAASLKNEAPLRYNVIFNVVGTKNVLDLAKQMKNLIHFQHVSTTMCIVEPKVVEEKYYEHPHNPDDLIRMSEWMSDEAMSAMQKELLGDRFSNTYMYTKRLAETLVQREYPNMPVCIVRPSLVMPSRLEPFPGWVDSMNGLTGIFVAGGRGVLRSLLIDLDGSAEIIPVDTAINGMIMVCKKLSMTEIGRAHV